MYRSMIPMMIYLAFGHPRTLQVEPLTAQLGMARGQLEVAYGLLNKEKGEVVLGWRWVKNGQNPGKKLKNDEK